MAMTGVEQRHGRGCRRAKGCDCPWRAEVYSKRDGRKIRKTFPTMRRRKRGATTPGGGPQADAAGAGVDDGREAAEAWLEGAREGVIRTRGRPLQALSDPGLRGGPAAAGAARARRVRLSEVTRHRPAGPRRRARWPGSQRERDRRHAASAPGDLQAGAAAPDGVAVNPTSDLQMPAVSGGRDRIASPEECAELLAALRRATARCGRPRCTPGCGAASCRRSASRTSTCGRRDPRSARLGPVEGEIAPKSGRTGACRSRRCCATTSTRTCSGSAGRTGWCSASKRRRRSTAPRSPSGRTERGRRRARADHAARVPAHVRVADDRRRRQRQGALTYMGHANIAITMDRYGHLFAGGFGVSGGCGPLSGPVGRHGETRFGPAVRTVGFAYGGRHRGANRARDRRPTRVGRRAGHRQCRRADRESQLRRHDRARAPAAERADGARDLAPRPRVRRASRQTRLAQTPAERAREPGIANRRDWSRFASAAWSAASCSISACRSPSAASAAVMGFGDRPPAAASAASTSRRSPNSVASLRRPYAASASLTRRSACGSRSRSGVDDPSARSRAHTALSHFLSVSIA